MKWTLSNYSHKNNFLSYYRDGLPRPNFEFCFKQVFSDFTASLYAFWHVLYTHLSGTDSQVGGRLHAASFIFSHNQLAYGEWLIFITLY